MRGGLSVRRRRSIRQRPQRRGLTQRQIARLAGAPRATGTQHSHANPGPRAAVAYFAVVLARIS